MPKSSDFDYEGLSVDNAGGWSSHDYHQRYKREPKQEQPPGGFQPVTGMVSPRKRRVHNDNPSQEIIDKTTKAAREDWKQRGLSNNTIKDY